MLSSTSNGNQSLAVRRQMQWKPDLLELATVMIKILFLLPNIHQRCRELRSCPLFNNREPVQTGPQELPAI
jgi:hypothetical protein